MYDVPKELCGAQPNKSMVGNSTKLVSELRKSSSIVLSPDHPQAEEFHSRAISHALIPIGNIPSLK
jgi:hypothetical protein